MNNELKAFEAARAAVYAAESANLSASTLARKWAAYFKAEAALKSAVGAGAR
jgi:hypothetical protein